MQTYSTLQELSDIIKHYINLGDKVEKLLLVKCSNDDIRIHIQSSVWGQYNRLGVDLSRGLDVKGQFIDENVDNFKLTNRFHPPVSYYDEYDFFVSTAPHGAYHLPYFVECVKKLKKPFVCLAGRQESAPGSNNEIKSSDLYGVEELDYTDDGSFVKEWFEWAEKKNLKMPEFRNVNKNLLRFLKEHPDSVNVVILDKWEGLSNEIRTKTYLRILEKGSVVQGKDSDDYIFDLLSDNDSLMVAIFRICLGTELGDQVINFLKVR
jgi:hypothetical protein